MIPHPSRLFTPSNERDLPAMTKSPRSEAKSRAKAEDRRVDPQQVQKMLKFRTSILALDPHAKFFADGNPLKVIHSKCGGQSTQKAVNDTSHFREHISVCQGAYSSSDDNSSLKSSLRGGPAPSIHPTMFTPVGSSELPCPGFSLEKLFGKDYRSLLNHEREKVTRAAEVAGFLWLDPKDKGSVVSMSCSKSSPSRQEPPQPCHNCLRVLELSNFKDTLRRGVPRSNSQRFSPWQRSNVKTTDAGEDRRATNVSQSPSSLTLADNTLPGECIADIPMSTSPEVTARRCKH